MKLVEAEQHANSLVVLLRDFTERIEVAGSIRRKKPDDIKDIEIVAVPKRSADGLNLLHWRIEELAFNGILTRGDKTKNGRNAPFGEKYYRLKYANGMNKVDLFVVIPPTCLSCGNTIKTSNDVHGDMRVLQKTIREPEQEILQQKLLEGCNEEAKRENMPGMPVSIFEGTGITGGNMFSEVRGDLQRTPQRQEQAPEVDDVSRKIPHLENSEGNIRRVYQSLSPGTPKLDEEGVYFGTPISDGETSREIPNKERSGSSSERNTERQQDRESGIGNAWKSQRRSNMPELQHNISNPLTCTKCGSDKLDLQRSQWGVIFLIRTGDSDFSHNIVQIGWPNNIRFVDGHLEQNGVVLFTPEEIDVFKALKVPWIDPELRTTTSLRYVLAK